MKSDYAYILGFITVAIAMYLAYLWSPDYLEFCSDGSGFLIIVVFGICMMIMISIIDYYFKTKEKKK